MIDEYKNTFKGSCHCENITFTLESNKDSTELVPRTCQCSLCKKHDASWISDPEGTLKIHYKNSDDVSFYRFGHKTSDFIVCAKCGVLTVALCDVNDSLRSAINIKPMLNHDFPSEEILTNFEGETVDERLERRAKNWMSNVTVSKDTLKIGLRN